MGQCMGDSDALDQGFWTQVVHMHIDKRDAGRGER